MAATVESLREDDRSFELLYQRDYARLVGYCRAMVGPTGDAEDIAQEALVRAWTSWERYEQDLRFWPLVTTIARRLWIDEVRRSSRAATRRHIEYELSVHRDTDPVERVTDAEDGRIALRALGSLSPRYQRLLWFRDIEGRAYDEIADLEGTSVGTVATSLRRARLALTAAYRRTSTGLAAALSFGWLGRLRQKIDQSWAQAGAPVAGAAMAVVLAAAPAVSAHGGSDPTTSAPAREIAATRTDGRETSAARVRATPTGGASAAAGRETATTDASAVKTDTAAPKMTAGPVKYFDYDAKKDEARRSEIVVEIGGTEEAPLIGIYANPREAPGFVEEQTP